MGSVRLDINKAAATPHEGRRRLDQAHSGA
jgi:hypothetical protein